MITSFDHQTLGQRVLFGSGAAAENTVAALNGLGAERPLVIAGASADALAGGLEAGGLRIAERIREIVQHVPVQNGRSAVERARLAGADAVLSVGGGSATGLGKFVARETGLPLVAVPTTFAGSEATAVWGQTENGTKTTGVDERVLPRVIVYDAALTVSLPRALATASGLNAVAHAIDGFWAPRADPINRALGAEGLRELVPALRSLHADPDDLSARERSLYGTYLASVAFASAGSGMHHKICHVLGGRFALSHAEMHAILIGYVVEFNAPAAPDAAERISASLGAGAPGHRLYRLRERLGVVGSLAELGLAEADIPEAARLAFDAIPASNPRPVTVADVETIIRLAWAGEPIEE